MKYQVISMGSVDQLEEYVNNAIKDGWFPKGGIAVNQFMYTSCNSPSMQTTYAQAMIKKG